MAVSWNKYSFYRIHRLTPFCIKTNLRENRFFAARVGDWWPKRALIMLNFPLKSWQKLVSWRVDRLVRRHVNKRTSWLFFSRSSKSALSRQDNVRASSTLFIWLNENVLLFVCWHKPVHFWHKNIRNMKKCSSLFPHYVPLTACFQLVENALNDLRQVTFCSITAFCHRQMWQVLWFYCIFVQYFVHERGVYLGFTA